MWSDSASSAPIHEAVAPFPKERIDVVEEGYLLR
jgi:hypothetical protein